MLDGSEIEFELEGPWRVNPNDPNLNYIALSFVDPSIGSCSIAAPPTDPARKQALTDWVNEVAESQAPRRVHGK